MNELNNGGDIYPTDLASAMSKANRWLVPTVRGLQDVAQHAAFSALKSKQGDKKDKKAHDRKAPTKGAPAHKAENLTNLQSAHTAAKLATTNLYASN